MNPARYVARLALASADRTFPAFGQSLPGDASVASITALPALLLGTGKLQKPLLPLPLLLGAGCTAHNPVTPAAATQNPEGLGCEAQTS
jgi:hypothetical protein